MVFLLFSATLALEYHLISSVIIIADHNIWHVSKMVRLLRMMLASSVTRFQRVFERIYGIVAARLSLMLGGPKSIFISRQEQTVFCPVKAGLGCL